MAELTSFLLRTKSTNFVQPFKITQTIVCINWWSWSQSLYLFNIKIKSNLSENAPQKVPHILHNSFIKNKTNVRYHFI